MVDQHRVALWQEGEGQEGEVRTVAADEPVATAFDLGLTRQVRELLAG